LRNTWKNVADFSRRKPLGACGGAVAVVLIIVAIFAPLIATDDPYKTDTKQIFAPPSTDMWFGGDQVGRDVYSRIVFGARISLYVGLVSALIGCTIGLLVGIASVHFGGATDLIVQRFVDALMAFPLLILAIALMAALSPSLENVIVALSVAFIPSTARILRSQAMAVKVMDYVLAARAIGAGDWRIMVRHMVPNCMAVYIVIVTFLLAAAIIAEASLSFLGVGAPPSEPSWGGMLRVAAQNYVSVSPWLGVFPGLAIAIVVFAWNLLGDALRDVLDPRLRGSGAV
jgi:peptide/nickel transport system permease protein